MNARAFTSPLLLAVALSLFACSSARQTGTGSGGNGGNGSGGSGTTHGSGGSGGNGGAGGAPQACEPFGHFGAPASTFTLPAQSGNGVSYFNYPDVQQAFPNVDWTKLDRLYLPAGSYVSLLIGNLPARDPAHPLVITNQGGQVVVGHNPMGNYIWSMSGGSGWVLTGRYDPDSGTGDAGFPGHRCGAYANSADKYGILSDDELALQAPYLHMGIAVGDATQFEIEYVEVRRSGFAGIRLLNQHQDGQPPRPMADVRVHDVYVHDTAGEGFYFGWTGGPPSNLMAGLQIYNTRILRTGNDALQIQDLGDGAKVHHNVFASGGLHWLDNGLGHYQDNNAQISTREGTIEIHHNVFLDGAGTIGSVWTQPQSGDGPRHVSFHDNYFGNTLSLGIYLGGDATSDSSFTFANNFFRGIEYAYEIVGLGNTAPADVLGFGGMVQAPITLTGNRWEGSRTLGAGLSADGMKGNVTASGNINGPVTPLAFRDAGYPIDVPKHHLTSWAPNATVASGSPAVTYHVGDVVTYGPNPDLYECTSETTAGPPPDHPEAWKKLPAPVDDVRLKADSPYAELGVR